MHDGVCRDIRHIAEGVPQAQREVEQRLEEANRKLHFLQQHSQNEQAEGIRGPGADHEELRRKIENGEVEAWYYLHDQLSKMKDQHSSNALLVHQIETLMEDASDHHR